MLTLEPRRVRGVLLLAVAALSALTVVSRSADQWAHGSTTAAGLEFFDAALEASVPTFFTSLLLLASAVLAVAMARADASMAGRWRLLALVLVALALDETIAFHEATIKPLRELLDVGGVLYFTWVVPGILFVIAVCATFAPLPARLPQPEGRIFVAAAAVFFGGAIGFELAEGWVVDRHGDASAALVPLTSIEETFEMVGVVLLLYALMQRLAPWAAAVRLTR